MADYDLEKRAPLLNWLLIICITCFSSVFLLLDYLFYDQVNSIIGALYILIILFSITLYKKPSVIVFSTILAIIFLGLGEWINRFGQIHAMDYFGRMASMFIILVVSALGMLQIKVRNESQFLENKFKIVFESAPNGMVLVDSQGKILIYNQQLANLFGYSKSDLINEKIETLVPLQHKKNHITQRDNYMLEPETRLMGQGRDLKGLREDGTEFPVEIGLTPILLPQGKFILASVINITDRKKWDELRDQFSGTVSHELKTPLATVLGILENFDEGYEGALDEEQKKLIKICLNNLTKVQRITQNLLSLTKSQKSDFQPKFQRFDANSFFNEIVDAFKILVKKENIQLNYHVEGKLSFLHADPDWVSQIINNIFSNALEYAKSKINLRVQEQKDSEGDFLKVSITNDGPPIPEDMIEKIFDKYYQAKSDLYIGNQFSIGLGLSLSQEMLQKMGGAIKAENMPHGGCCFSFTLPCQKKSRNHDR